jgi:hypothetical protein|tara:strand:+ start:874 stop:1107 length:234 start_codon:yes stop_codon:yes gene_type:complete
MNKKNVEKWVDIAEIGSCVIYYSGHLTEDKNDIHVREPANAFMKAAQKGRVELFQNKKEKGNENHKPVYDYIARKKI